MGVSKLGYRRYWTDPMPQNEIDWLESNGHINTINQYCDFLQRYSLHTAISGNSFKKTYQELLDDVGKARKYLFRNQINKGDIVGVQMSNEYLFVVMFLAITTIGAVIDVFPTQMPISLIQMFYQQHKLKLLIHSSHLNSLYVRFDFNHVCANDVTDNEFAPPIENNPNDLAALYFTGGTIGKPKSVMLTHKNLMRGMTNGAYGFNKILGLKYLTIIPFFHVFGLVRSLLTVLYTGSENYLCEDFKSFLPNLKLVNPNLVCITPALLEMICYFGKQDIKLLGSSLQTIVVGGATTPPNLLEQANALGIYTCQGYGLTETSNLVSGNRFSAKNPSSVGEIFDFQEIKIVNQELWIKGENISPGYFLDKLATQTSYEDGWFKTGDLMKYENNELYLIGRIKNLIFLNNGEKFSPEEIENKFNNFPLIKDSLVYLKDDQIILEVFPREVNNLTLEIRNQEITDFFHQINNESPTFMNINKLIIRTEDFKRSPAMKILRIQ